MRTSHHKYPCVTPEGYKVWVDTARVCGLKQRIVFCDDCTEEFQRNAKRHGKCPCYDLKEARKWARK